MDERDDISLLDEFARTASEAAFSVLVRRHLDLVYSVALRKTGNPHAAEEVAQAVFITLARKASKLRKGTLLAGWLYEASRLTAANYVRGEIRRVHREQEALMQQSPAQELTPDAEDTWQQMTPLLEPAMGRLNEPDRAALVLRFFENKSMREVGTALGTTEDAAKMRVGRALEKLRRFFARAGFAVSVTMIANSLSAKPVQTAPPALHGVVLTAVTDVKAATASVTALSAATSQMLAMAKLKLLIKPGALVLLVIVGTVASLVLLNPKGQQQPKAGLNETNQERPEQPIPATREPITTDVLLTLVTPPGAIELQPDGKILIGSTLGGFAFDPQSRVMGYYTRGAMRFNSDGSLDRSFYCDVGRPGASSAMAAGVRVLDGNRVFISGIFESVDGQPRHGHALLQSNGRLDASFDPWGGETNVSSRIDSSRLTYSSAVLPDGSIAVMSRPVEESKASWAAYRLDPTGRILFPALTNDPWSPLRPAKLILSYSDISLGPFPEVPLELVRYAVRLPDGGAIIAVRDTPINGIMRIGRLKRFTRDWEEDASFTNQFTIHAASEISLHLQPDGKLLVAGMVGEMNGEEFPGLVRLNPNGEVDRTFHCRTTNSLDGRIMDLKMLENGQIVICGFFSEVNGVACPHIARLNHDGSLDATFETPFLSMQEFNRRRFADSRPVAKQTPGHAPGASSPPLAQGVDEMVTIVSLEFERSVAVVRFNGQANQTYVLQAADVLGSDQWINIGTNSVPAGGRGQMRDPDAADHAMRFYRIVRP